MLVFGKLALKRAIALVGKLVMKRTHPLLLIGNPALKRAHCFCWLGLEVVLF